MSELQIAPIADAKVKLTEACHEILQLLLKGPRTPLQLAQETARARLTVYKCLARLKARGLVEKTERAYSESGRPPCEWRVASSS